MEKTIFEMIVAGDIPSMKVYEDDKYLAILDIAPRQQGHTLLIPKIRKENILEDPEAQKDILFVANQIANKLKERLGATGIKLVFNNGASAGQEVFHTHLHIIPYFDNQIEIKNDKEVLVKINGQ